METSRLTRGQITTRAIAITKILLSLLLLSLIIFANSLAFFFNRNSSIRFSLQRSGHSERNEEGRKEIRWSGQSRWTKTFSFQSFLTIPSGFWIFVAESCKNLEQKFISQLSTLNPHKINKQLSFHKMYSQIHVTTFPAMAKHLHTLIKTNNNPQYLYSLWRGT